MSLNEFRSKKLFFVFAAVIVTGIVVSAAQNLANPSRFPDATGIIETISTDKGPIGLTGPFFQPFGTNGRSCGTCHVPGDGWSVSAQHVAARFDATAGLDPIFRTNDGSNCDHAISVATEDDRRRAYSLLTSRGLIRIFLPVPAGAEFRVVSVNNPYGCSDTSTISVYRRPLPATNLRFLSAVMWDGRESAPPDTVPITYQTNPQDLIRDLAHQALDATLGHGQADAPGLTAAQQQAIVNFELATYTAQAADSDAGPLNAQGAGGGPGPLTPQAFYIGINDPLGSNPLGTAFTPMIFDIFSTWANLQGQSSAVIRRRSAIARGEALFNSKPITITGVAGLNDSNGRTVITGTCGTCHDSPQVGDHSVALALDIGVADVTNPLGVGYLPVITLQNLSTNAIVQTTDPGRALITGKWQDIGKVKGPVLRGLAARAPYFHNGSAASLNDLIRFYDRRFQIGFTQQEEDDLAAFLAAL